MLFYSSPVNEDFVHDKLTFILSKLNLYRKFPFIEKEDGHTYNKNLNSEIFCALNQKVEIYTS